MSYRIEFGNVERICRNPITKGYHVTYCMRPLDRVDSEGKRTHHGPCSIDPNYQPAKPETIPTCNHSFANRGNCKTCRGSL